MLKVGDLPPLAFAICVPWSYILTVKPTWALGTVAKRYCTLSLCQAQPPKAEFIVLGVSFAHAYRHSSEPFNRWQDLAFRIEPYYGRVGWRADMPSVGTLVSDKVKW